LTDAFVYNLAPEYAIYDTTYRLLRLAFKLKVARSRKVTFLRGYISWWMVDMTTNCLREEKKKEERNAHRETCLLASSREIANSFFGVWKLCPAIQQVNDRMMIIGELIASWFICARFVLINRFFAFCGWVDSRYPDISRVSGNVALNGLTGLARLIFRTSQLSGWKIFMFLKRRKHREPLEEWN